jgi:signal transduction histidine kinase
MVRAVAEKHGGRAWAERTAEGRIRFVCELPQSRET